MARFWGAGGGMEQGFRVLGASRTGFWGISRAQSSASGCCGGLPGQGRLEPHCRPGSTHAHMQDKLFSPSHRSMGDAQIMFISLQKDQSNYKAFFPKRGLL